MLDRTLVASVLVLVPQVAMATDGLTDPPRPQHVAGGEVVEECAWVDTVAVLEGGGLCSGSLVHPQVVVFAAHCGAGEDKEIKFGESINSGGYTRAVDRCMINPDYLGTSDQGHDWAFCVLAEPITEIPVTPPAYGCELDMIQEGQAVVIAGFGNNTDNGGAGTKRWAATTIVSTLGSTASIGTGGISTCEGDSGSSAFIQLADGSYRSISMTSTGVGCGLTGVHALMHPAIPWIEMEAGIDITPCHDVDGTWNPTGACTGFYSGGETPHGIWTNWCEGTPSTGASDSCGDPYDAVADADAPTVAITGPTDGEELPSGSSITIAFDATDDGWGVKETWIAIDGMDLPNLDLYPPYAFDNVQFPDGIFRVQAFARDWADNVGSSSEITIGVGMAPPSSEESSGSGGLDTSTGGGETTGPLGESEGEGEGGESSTSPQSEGGGGGGCGCSRGVSGTSGLGLLVLAVLFGARRRRSSR